MAVPIVPPFLICPQTWEFPVRMFDEFLLTLFKRYADLLKTRFSDDFQEVTCHPNRVSHDACTYCPRKIVSTDDYMPMPIQTPEEFDKVLNVSWYNPERPREEQTYVLSPSVFFISSRMKLNGFPRFPCVLPFSQMYPLCCIDIRNFLNQFYFFATDDFPYPSVIDETLKDVSIGAEHCKSPGH